MIGRCGCRVVLEGLNPDLRAPVTRSERRGKRDVGHYAFDRAGGVAKLHSGRFAAPRRPGRYEMCLFGTRTTDGRLHGESAIVSFVVERPTAVWPAA